MSQQNPQPTEHQRTAESEAAPEFTPQITAKQAQRVNAPARGMIISMAVLVLLALPFFLLQPRPDGQTYRPDVNVAQEASYAADVAQFQPLAPDLGEGYSPNFARWQGNTADGVDRWEAGWVTPSSRFIELVQTDLANPTWLVETVDQAPQTGSREAHGLTWETYQKENDQGQLTRAWVGELDGSTVVLKGSATEEEFDHAAQAVVAADTE
ncbi:DUF4245 domain-containing protein [Kocuria sp.]|uniref:DUF4245 domain-containing protein n=1 Tax=Kocuria sp. TaxID=1871328 RepID=UPI0026DF6B7F|nr:DUF4245 domain-containing protein [Kocuria sp.]MDO5617510.1 DUF4245 domain-containing protein [Kocuria sp.]